MQTTLLHVSGMTCGSCVARVTSALGKVDGVDHVGVSLATGEATVKFDEQVTSMEELVAAVRNAGYGTEAAQAVKPKSSGGCCCH